MKKIILIFILCLSFSACAQKEVEQSPVNNINQELTEEIKIIEEKSEPKQEPKLVDVKYCDEPVDIALFEELDTSKSSWVRGAWYDAENEYMVINLSGTYYHYCSLPLSIWEDFKSASSFGSEFNKNIKGKFACE